VRLNASSYSTAWGYARVACRHVVTRRVTSKGVLLLPGFCCVFTPQHKPTSFVCVCSLASRCRVSLHAFPPSAVRYSNLCKACKPATRPANCGDHHHQITTSSHSINAIGPCGDMNGAGGCGYCKALPGITVKEWAPMSKSGHHCQRADLGGTHVKQAAHLQCIAGPGGTHPDLLVLTV
jgi:hypothetical protein